jgi:hypothetical protein
MLTDVQGNQIKSGEVTDDEVIRIFNNEVEGEKSVTDAAIEKPEGIEQEQWDNSTPEEKVEMIRQQKEC